MLGWITGLFELVGYIFGTIQAVFEYLVNFISYTIGFVVGMATFVNDLATSMTWIVPILSIGAFFVTLAIVRLCVSLGGHSG